MTSFKIAFINPQNKLFQGNALPPLGLITNAAFIPEEFEVRIVDENRNMDKGDADLFAITANSVTTKRAYDICDELKKKGVPTVIGGIHPSMMPDEAKSHATSVVIGEGESVWENILHDFKKGQLKPTYTTPAFQMEKSRVPRRDLLKHKYLFNSIETSRGCPFSCDFCSVTKLYGASYRYKPLSQVSDELEIMNKKKILFLVDDNFLGVGKAARDRCIKLMELLKQHDVRWLGQTSVNIANDPELLKLAQDSGAISFFIGFESLNEDFLRSSKKFINLEQCKSSYRHAIRNIHDHGITVMGSFIYGTDYDSLKSLRDLINFTNEEDIDSVHINPLTPLPGTNLYESLRREGRLFDDNYWLQDPYPIFTFKPLRMDMADLVDATLAFHDNRNVSRSIPRFLRSYYDTRNFHGSLLNFMKNVSEYYTNKKLVPRMKELKRSSK